MDIRNKGEGEKEGTEEAWGSINSLGPKFLSLGHFQSIEHLKTYPNFCSLALLGSKLLTQVISATLSIYVT